MSTFNGTTGNDTFPGTTGDDTYRLKKGGDDTATGDDGNDTFQLGGTLTAADSLDGGTGDDRVILSGDYSAGVTFLATTLTNIETLSLNRGHSYNFTTHEATVAAGATFTVNGLRLGVGDSLVFDGSAEHDGFFILRGGRGDDTLTGGAKSDTFNLIRGGDDTANGGAGKDVFQLDGEFDAADRIDGGVGADKVNLTGNYAGVHAVVFGATTMTNVETLQLGAGHNYNLTTHEATVASGATLTVDASALGAGDSLTFDGSAETDGSFNIAAGAGDDTLTGGTQNDTLAGNDGIDVFSLTHGGNDIAYGGAGNDAIFAGGALTAADAIDGGADFDTLYLDGDYSAGLTFGTTTLTNIEKINILQTGNIFTSNDATVAAGETLIVNGLHIPGIAFTFDGSSESDGSFSFIGGTGNDVLTGGAQADTFDLFGAGDDTANGGGGDDTISMGAALTAADTIDGGANSDTLKLNGDYSGANAVTFGAATVTNVENIVLATGHSYDLTTLDVTVGGFTMTVDGSALGGADTLTFNGAAETGGGAGRYAFIGGAGDDVLSGGAYFNGDEFYLTLGGNDTAHGGGGGDTFILAAAFTAADTIDGGMGAVDIVYLDGDYSGGLTFGVSTLTNVEYIGLAADHDYNLTTNNATVASAAALGVNASALGSGDALTFNGAAEMDGSFTINAGAGNDVLTGGAQADTFDLSNGGNDTANGGGGDDTFTMGAAFTATDTIDGGSGYDRAHLDGDYTGANAVVFGAATMVKVERISLNSGHSYDLTTANETIAAFDNLFIDASGLGAADALTFDGSAETDGTFYINAGAGNDVLKGGDGSYDTYVLYLGGDDTAYGGAGTDYFSMGSAFTAADNLDGGAGSDDTVEVNGVYAAPIVFTAATMINVENLYLYNGPYDLTTDDATVAAGALLKVWGGGATGLMFDGSAEQDGSFQFDASYGDDVLTGGAQADTFGLSAGGTDTFYGGGGNDAINAGGPFFTAADTIDGGADSDTFRLSGNFTGGGALVFAATTMTNVETLSLVNGYSYDLTTDNATVGTGQTLTVDASTLFAADTLTFNGSAETDGSFAITGGAGNDVLTGGDKIDTFFLGGGGDDTASGGGGNDTFNLGMALTASDTISGGAGTDDTINLNGDYSGGTTFGATTLNNIETIILAAGHDYNLTTNDATVASGTLTVNAGALNSSNSLTFDGSAETNAGFFVFAGAGDDILTGGNVADAFLLSAGGNDTVYGGGGFNLFYMGASFTAADSIDGGTGGAATISLNGDYTGAHAVVMAASTMVNITGLSLDGGHSYDLTTDNANLLAGNYLVVSAGVLASADSLVFSGAAETDGFLSVLGGAGNDTLTGGALADTINGGAGIDDLTGGAGADTLTGGADIDRFHYAAASQSTSTTYDTISGFDAADDFFDFEVTVVKYDGQFTSAVAINAGATFDANLLAASVGDFSLSPSGAHAIVVNAGTHGGTLDGHSFLVVDVNGDAAYTTGLDYVIDITGASNLASLLVSNFI